jgi:hypothetical protein
VAKFLYKMSDIDTAEFRKLTLLAAGIDPSEIPPILDTAEWRRLLIVAINNASSGGGTAGVFKPDLFL